MKYLSKQSGFAMLEVLLAVVVIAMASFGAYMLFGTGSSQTQTTQMTNELNQIASAYSTLASSNLTGSVSSPQDVVNLLYNSNQLSKNYFSSNNGTNSLTSPFGKITFTNPSAIGFTLEFYFGTEKTNDQSQALYNSVQNNYDCVSGCGGSSNEGSQGKMKLKLDISN